jgi:hypothetical protein
MYSNTFPGLGNFQQERYPNDKSEYSGIHKIQFGLKQAIMV